MLINQAAWLSCVGDIIGGTLASLKIHLYTAYDGTQQPSPDNFTEASFSNYADQTITWNGEQIYPDNSVGELFQCIFQGGSGSPGSPVSQNVLGYYVTDTSSTNVIFWEAFSNPYPMVDEYSFLPIQGELHFDPNLPVGTSEIG
jgi:hypothetical protein